LVHRLDKDTSGLILVAKTKEAARLFSGLFSASGMVTRRYLGICRGSIEKAQGLIRLGLDTRVRGKSRNESGKALIQKESETSYRLVSEACAGGFPCSLLELELSTGRMHQIRRHLALMGHPLLGDDKYGDFPLNRQMRKAAGLKRLLLHASRLIISPLPELPSGLDVEAPLPDSWQEYLQAPLP
jgi:23S rRNA pseudouridine955/2504/2580 synthase